MTKNSKRIARLNARKCNRYFASYPIDRRKDATVLASEVCWDIVEILREVGVQGLTSKEIQDRLKIKRYPRSTIYAALSQLETAGMIKGSRPIFPWGRPLKEIEKRVGRDKARGGRPRKLYHANLVWAFEVDDNFAESLGPVAEKYIEELKQIWLKTLENIVEEYKTSDDLKEFYPKDIICPDCDLSHEAFEFLRAISYYIVHYIEYEKEWRQFAKKHGFMK